jgi:anti-sigma regulatory factor (Ser/Thr protein kinase)
MSPDTPHRFPARMASLPEAMALLGRECAAHGVAQADELRLGLLLEELFTNTVHHGHGGDCDEPVYLGWNVRQQEVVFHYADRAPAFDPRPLAQARAPAARDGREEIDMAQQPVGQLGLVLVGQISDKLHYAYEGGWNTLHLHVRLRRGA